MDFLYNKCVVFTLLLIIMTSTSKAEGSVDEENRVVGIQIHPKTSEKIAYKENSEVYMSEGRSRVKRQFGGYGYGYPYYGRRRPFPPIIFGGIGLGIGIGESYGGRGFGGRGYGGRGFGGRGIGGRGIGGRGIGGRGIGGRGGGGGHGGRG